MGWWYHFNNIVTAIRDKGDEIADSLDRTGRKYIGEPLGVDWFGSEDSSDDEDNSEKIKELEVRIKNKKNQLENAKNRLYSVIEELLEDIDNTSTDIISSEEFFSEIDLTRHKKLSTECPIKCKDLNADMSIIKEKLNTSKTEIRQSIDKFYKSDDIKKEIDNINKIIQEIQTAKFGDKTKK